MSLTLERKIYNDVKFWINLFTTYQIVDRIITTCDMVKSKIQYLLCMVSDIESKNVQNDTIPIKVYTMCQTLCQKNYNVTDTQLDIYNVPHFG